MIFELLLQRIPHPLGWEEVQCCASRSLNPAALQDYQNEAAEVF